MSAVSGWGQGDAALDAITRAQHFEARRASSSNADLTRNGDAKSIAPGATLVLMDEDGPGMITHFWNTLGAFDPFHGRSVALRIYYDGNEKPSVEAPLGDFFGVGHGAYKDFTSAPVTVSSHGRSRACYWRIPFRKHIKVTVTNESPTYKVDSFYYYLDWQKHETLPKDTMYFQARYRQAFPAQPGNYVILDTRGRGHYVGTVYSAHQVETGWFGEGDDFFYIDGAETPQLRGTGTEDYFNDAWGFREFCSPYHGVTLYEGVLTGDRVTAYRWHLQDPIPFQKSLRLEIEHRGSIFNDRGNLATFELGGFEERPDWVSSVAFWYQYPPAVFEEPMPPAEQRVAPHRIIKYDQLTYRANPPFLVVPQDPYLSYIPNTPKASIEFDFDVAQDGRYRIDGIFLHGLIAGVYQASLDGRKLGWPMDFVILNFDPMWRSLDTHDLKAGKHTLRFEGVDQAAPEARELGPKFYGFGLAYLMLLRLDDMEGYQQVLKEKLSAMQSPPVKP
jgi:hypothetical protein